MQEARSAAAIALLAAAVALQGCGCGEVSLAGDADGHEVDVTDVLDTVDSTDVPPVPCNSDEDCDDGIACNGEEACSPDGLCEPGVPISCDDGDPCTSDMCDPVADACSSVPLDLDGDGYVAARGPGGEECGDDCDDARAEAHPGAWELCNLLDDDCDALVDETDILLPPTQITTGESSNSITGVEWAGDRFALLWNRSLYDGTSTTRTPVIRMVSPEGETLGVEGVPGSTAEAYGGSLSWTGTGFLVAYTDRIPINSQIYACGFDMDGALVGAPAKISDGPLQSTGPDVAWSGSEIGLAWTDDRDGNAEIYFARVGADGERIGPEVRVTNASGGSQGPSINWTGSDYSVVWFDKRDMWIDSAGVYTRRMSGDGAMSGDETCLMAPAESHDPAQITKNDDGYAWTVRHSYTEDAPGDPGMYEQHVDTWLHGATLSGVTSDGVMVSSIEYVTWGLDMEAEDFLLSWKGNELGVFDYHGHAASPMDLTWSLSFRRLETDGAWMGSEVTMVESAMMPNGGMRAMAWSGSTFGLAWSKQPEGAADTREQVFFAIVAPCL